MIPSNPCHSFAKLLLAILSLLPLAANSADSALPTEAWRPQFHFTPATNWMNDPNGMVYYEGEYHLFYQFNPFGIRWGHMSWGHAVSRDLVQWEHLPIALMEENGVMIFSGSAVVDWKNTSGFGKDGKPPMVAVYTGHYTTKQLQNQQIAYSNDRGRTWTKYAGNPVLDIGEADFRDPKVFWHEPTQQWIMAVSWPQHRQVRFYASANLKQWSHLSDFGPAGSTTGIWECPDLFPVQVEGQGGQKKWVLVVNVGSGAPAGGSGCQYFVGDFDGRQFSLDASFPKPEQEFVPNGLILGDFEGEGYGSWKAAGEAFATSPARGKIGGQQAVDGFRGTGLLNSFRGGDKSEGSLTSTPFEINRKHLSFLIGGGNHANKTCVNLRVDGTVVRTATGDNAERLSWKSWNLSDLQGKKGILEVVDREQGGWGHINADHFVLADEPARPAQTPALWADWGRDFYAAVSWSDIPPRDGRRLWLGWMSNWEYANDVPTVPWRSAMSIPRELTLRSTATGLRLVQKPVRELASYRGKQHRYSGASLAKANQWLQKREFATSLLEVELEVQPRGTEGITLELATERNETVEVHCDPLRSSLILDRTRSGRIDFHNKFPGRYEAPLGLRDGKIKLNLVIDRSSLEVFGDDGLVCLTSLLLPEGKARTFRFREPVGAWKIQQLRIWELQIPKL